jgi:hypothetical protein
METQSKASPYRYHEKQKNEYENLANSGSFVF